jgi:hypothetical protein
MGLVGSPLCSGVSFSECLKNLLGEAVIRRIFILRLVIFCVIVRLLRIGLPHAQERARRSNPHLYKRALRGSFANKDLRTSRRSSEYDAGPSIATNFRRPSCPHHATHPTSLTKSGLYSNRCSAGPKSAEDRPSGPPGRWN